LEPLANCGTDEARNFKFGTQTDDGKYHLTGDKIRQKYPQRGISEVDATQEMVHHVESQPTVRGLSDKFRVLDHAQMT